MSVQNDVAIHTAGSPRFQNRVLYWSMVGAFAYLGGSPTPSQLKFAAGLIDGSLNIARFSLAVIASNASVSDMLGNDPDGTLVDDATLQVAVFGTIVNLVKVF